MDSERFYITGIAILIGAEINSEIEIASNKIGKPESKPARAQGQSR